MKSRESGRQPVRNFDRLFHGLNLAESVFFYPCCSSDVSQPIRFFAPHISRFCFADIQPPPVSELRKAVDIHEEHSVVISGYEFLQYSPEDVPRRELERIADLRALHNYSASYKGSEFEISWYQCDAVHALQQIDQVTVFCHRSDGPIWGEGSSGIPWLQKDLFSLVIDKIVDNGLLVTDGSCGHYPDTEHPHSPLWRDLRANKSDCPASMPEDFELNHARFRCLGTFLSRRGVRSYIWKISKPGALL